MREISQGCAFVGFVKNGNSIPTSSQILKILHYKSHFSLKTHQSWSNLHQNSLSYRESVYGGFKLCVKNLTGSGILAIWAHVQQKIKLAKTT